MQKEYIKTEICLEVHECYKCHIMFAMPEDLVNRARKSQDVVFYCPNGHGAVYTETTEMRLRYRLDQAEAKLENQRNITDGTLRQLAAQKGHNTRLRKRIQAGVCPDCHRHFENLQRHMEIKHPNKD